jgi:iron complex outermembrane receptor protein
MLKALMIKSTLIACVFSVSFAAHAVADAPKRINVPAGELVLALQSLANQAAVDLVYQPEQLRSFRTNGVKGDYTPEAAIRILLKGTPLELHTDPSGAMVIAPPHKSAPPATSAISPAPSPRSGLQLAQASPGSTPLSARALSEAATPVLEEVVVTAEKRAESSLDVPMSLTALSGEQLARSQSYRLEDFAGKVPGLTFIDDGPLGSQLVIRGLTSGSAAVNSSVATYVDETPYTAVGPFSGSNVISPNLDAFDMQRIEVLRGPQGTLYGASALGGLLKYVTNAPDPSGFAANAAVGFSSVSEGGQGYDVHAMVNVPLAENAALRLVGYTNHYPGFIDDPSRGATDINEFRYQGFRGSLLYNPTDDLSLRVNALYQDRSWSDSSNEDVNPGTLAPIYADLIQEHLIGQPGYAKTQIYNFTLNWDLGFAQLLSSSSYSRFNIHTVSDLSVEFGPLVSSILGVPAGITDLFTPSDRAFTQEVRLSSAGGGAVQWQVGGFFTDQKGADEENFFPIDAATRAILADNTVLGAVHLPVGYREYAGFVNIDYFITPVLDVSLGGRYSENHQTFHETGTGIFGGGADFGATSSQGVFTYSGDARWHMTAEHMLYARIANGFVPGGPNSVSPTAGAPNSYSSSTAVNYEAGIKSSLLDHHLTVEVSAFHIDWRKIQLEAVIGGFNQFVNGSQARSDGAEWNFTYVPVRGLTLNLNGAYTHAYLTEPTPASVNGLTGDRLPAVPLLGSSASVMYEHDLFGAYSGFAAVDWQYTGSRYSNFTATGPRQQIPAFNVGGLRSGVETNHWMCTLYVKNVGDRRAINYIQPEALSGGFGPQSAVVFTPRTIGVTLTAKF